MKQSLKVWESGPLLAQVLTEVFGGDEGTVAAKLLRSILQTSRSTFANDLTKIIDRRVARFTILNPQDTIETNYDDTD